ncbi:TetR family transcriptional regulator [Chitinivorax sp. B]|uniref:TetR family transcriptional regulator n=1 Tax=Chitinivorax sp. B TaxID=2502235 RepID=UPI0010F6064A|nr:TetR family transcriptional regulator [Chitinivorax sp. B]
MARRTKEEALETRNQLLDSAEQLFSANGVAQTTLNDVAANAGLTRGAIYWHFKNKADLLEALCERARMPLEDAMNSLNDSHASPLDRIRAKSVEVLRQVVGDAHCRSVFNITLHKCEFTDELASLKKRHLEGRDDCLSQIEQEFAEAAASGQLRKDIKPRMAAIGLLSYIDGLLYHWLPVPEYFSLGDEADALIDIYLSGLIRNDSR